MRKSKVQLGAPMCKLQFSLRVLTALACAFSALPVLADSQARIVRLSDVQGTAQIDKNTGLGFENAFLNLPITQGTQLRTKESGRIEIEFEDGSTLRLTPNTAVEFSILGLDDAGKRVSVVNLVEGKAYVNWLGKSGDRFTLNFSREKIDLSQAAHFRVAVLPSMAELASFKNDVEVVGPSDTVKVGKKQMRTFDVNDPDRSTVARNFEEDPYDQWDKQAIEYHEQYSKNNSTPYGYGYSDLNYYGGYTNIAGYGSLWQPYFTGVGWDPFMDGAWSWYPGFGFMFASAYPWGWLPYYYGNWIYAPGFGWGWRPGGWGGWSGVPRCAGVLPVGFHAPVAPTGTVKMVAVGKGGTVVTRTVNARMVVNSGSAGLGIPRGSFGNLSHLNRQVAKTGSLELRSAPQFSAMASHGGGYGSGQVAGSGHSAPHSVTSAASTGHVSSAPAGHASGSTAHR
ncbi:MAG: FecR family protein [Candidatus Sulfotelmatobacter sp.]